LGAVNCNAHTPTFELMIPIEAEHSKHINNRKIFRRFYSMSPRKIHGMPWWEQFERR